MYDELSEVARDVALLCPYLGNDWNVFTLSIALDQPTGRIERAITELEDKGILLASMPSREGAVSVLPLTTEFLANKWHERKGFREGVMDRIANAVASPGQPGNLFDWPVEERIKVLREKAVAHEEHCEFDHALRLVKLASQWSSGGEDTARLRFLEGRIVYKSGNKRDGIVLMQSALDQLQDEGQTANDVIFLAQAMLFHGRSSEEGVALERIVRHISNSDIVTQKLIDEFCSRTLRQRDYPLLSRLLENARQKTYVYWIARAILPYLDDRQLVYSIGESLIKVMRQAANADEASKDEKSDFLERSSKISALFNLGKKVFFNSGFPS